MNRYEVSTCCLDWVFDFSSLIVYARDKNDAMREFIERLKDHLESLTSSDIEKITKQSDDCIYKPIIDRMNQEKAQ